MRPGWNPGRYAKKEKTRFEWKVRGTGWQDHKTFFKGVLVLILVIGGIFIADHSLKGSAGTSPLGDPIKPLWYDSMSEQPGGNQIRGWLNNTGGDHVPYFPLTCYSGLVVNCIRLQSNSSRVAVAINQSPIDVSPVANNALEFQETMNPNGCRIRPGDPAYCPPFAYFLTRNNTAPIENYGYNPVNDKNVAFEVAVFPGTPTSTIVVYQQSDASRPISSNDAGCGAASDVWLCSTQTITFKSLFTYWFIADLNYTANKNVDALSYLTVQACQAGNCAATFTRNQTTTVKYPVLPPTGSKLYFGIWQGTCSQGCFTDFEQDFTYSNASPLEATTGGINSFLVAVYIPFSTGPNLNPGGFFGPLLKGLITISVNALAYIIGFLAYLLSLVNGVTGAIGPILQSIWSGIAGFFWGLIISTLNTVGGLFGAGSIGTQFSSFINNSAGLIGSLITNVLAMGTNLVTLLTNLITWTFGANGFFLMIFNGVNTWLTLLFNLLGSIQKILTMIFKGSTIGLSFLFLFDALWLMIIIHDDGMRGISEEWWPIHNLLIVSLAKLVFFILGMFGQYLYWVVSMIELAIEDVKPNVSVGAG